MYGAQQAVIRNAGCCACFICNSFNKAFSSSTSKRFESRTAHTAERCTQAHILLLKKHIHQYT